MRKNASCSATAPRTERRLARRAPVRFSNGEAAPRITYEPIRARPMAAVDLPKMEIEGDALVAPALRSRCPIRGVRASRRAALDGVQRLALRGDCVLMPAYFGNLAWSDCFYLRCLR